MSRHSTVPTTAGAGAGGAGAGNGTGLGAKLDVSCGVAACDASCPPAEAPELLNLGCGFPGTDINRAHTVPVLQRAMAALTADADRLERFMQYGFSSGDEEARASIARMLTDELGVSTSPDQLCITAGASSAFDLACATFADAGDTIVVEEPTYFLANPVLADHGLKVVSVGTDGDGLDIDELERKLDDGLSPKLLYTIPTFQNPSGSVMPEPRRRRLVQLARKFNFIILSDDVYQLLNCDGAAAAPLPMSYFDVSSLAEGATGDTDAARGGAISMGSFSKLLFPGLRVGWMHGRPELLEQCAARGVIRSGGCRAHFNSGLVMAAIDSGDFAALLPKLRLEYRNRLDALVNGLTKHCPTLSFTVPTGGYFVWVQLPAGAPYTAKQLLDVASSKFGVSFHEGDKFSSTGALQHCFRLGFCYYLPEHLEEATRRLAKAMAAMSDAS